MSSDVVAVFDLEGAVQRSVLDIIAIRVPQARALIELAKGLGHLGRTPVLRSIERHRRLGHDLVLISHAPPETVKKTAGELGFSTGLSADIEGKVPALETYIGAARPSLWVYAAPGQAILDLADVAVTVDRWGRLSALPGAVRPTRAAEGPSTPPERQDLGGQDTGPLPYEEGLTDAEQIGRVLHRHDIYGTGPPVDAFSGEILEFVAANTGASILDVGCGIGPYVEQLTLLGRHCVGVDLDAGAVDGAKRLGRDVRLMSAYDLDFPDDAFDSVILVEALEHLDDYEAALAEAARVARKTIVVTVPDISVIPAMSKRLVVPWHLLEATHVNFFTPETLRKTLLRYAASCESTRLGAFFEVDGLTLHMHAAAVARLQSST